VWHEAYEVDLGPHVFVTAKYRLTGERLLRGGRVTEEHFLTPSPATRSELGLVHTATYLDAVEQDTLTFAERVRLEIPLTPSVRDAMKLACGGTLLTCRLALAGGASAHLGGGFHHAFADHGEGFCLFNDVAVAVRVLMAEGVVSRPLIVDLDVHQGNGTAAIFASDPRVFTLSLHQEDNYPADKPASTLDVGFDDGTGDADYLEALGESLSRAVDAHRPDLIVYLAGADPYRDDQLGGLSLTKEGLGRRDRTVFDAAIAREIPIAVVLAGGYAHRLEDTVAIHTATVTRMIESLSNS
jgi:acetoin utilization deacetylase AcuC-like enzyme